MIGILTHCNFIEPTNMMNAIYIAEGKAYLHMKSKKKPGKIAGLEFILKKPV